MLRLGKKQEEKLLVQLSPTSGSRSSRTRSVATPTHKSYTLRQTNDHPAQTIDAPTKHMLHLQSLSLPIAESASNDSHIKCCYKICCYKISTTKQYARCVIMEPNQTDVGLKYNGHSAWVVTCMTIMIEHFTN